MSDQPPQQPNEPLRRPPDQPYRNDQQPPSYGQRPRYGSQPPAYAQEPHDGQPPRYGQPLSDQSTQPMFGNQSQPAYPRQELLPQEVQPAPSRLPLVLTLVVVLLLIGGGIGAWLVLRDSGEAHRADYCAALKKLVPDNDLIAAFVQADDSTADQIAHVAELAPTAVHDDWQTLSGLLSPDTSSSSASPADMLAGIGALRGVVQDANDNCGMSIQVPSFGQP